MNKIKISIVVPMYNVELYADKCIESITKQTYGNIEIIIVDDGSTDKSGVICDDWKLRDNRITVLHKDNGGLVSARKAGMRIATGDYIVSVDGDDWIEDDWIEQYADAIGKSGADIIYRDGVYRDTKGILFNTSMNVDERLYNEREIQNEFVNNLLQFSPGIEKKIKLNSVSWAYRADIAKKQIEHVRDDFTTCEDLVFVTYCIFNSSSIYITRGGGYHYIQRLESMSFTEVDCKTMSLLYSDICAFLEQKNVDSKVKQIYNDMFSVNMLCINYKEMVRLEKGKLPFFPKVKQNSRVIIYGAGRVGRHMLSAIEEKKSFSIVAVADTFPEKYKDSNIWSIEDACKLEYDYVIVASIISQHIKQMTEKLLQLNVPVHKIAAFEYENIDFMQQIVKRQ